jgi:hypothetical protein
MIEEIVKNYVSVPEMPKKTHIFFNKQELVKYAVEHRTNCAEGCEKGVNFKIQYCISWHIKCIII